MGHPITVMNERTADAQAAEWSERIASACSEMTKASVSHLVELRASLYTALHRLIMHEEPAEQWPDALNVILVEWESAADVSCHRITVIDPMTGKFQLEPC